MNSWRGLIAVLVSATVGLVGFAATAGATIPPLYKNCTNFNKRYHHGVGRFGAHDKTSGIPVTTFFRSNRVYAVAIKYNRGLDRDKDGIACESA